VVSLDSPVSSINKTDRHDITEILLKVALNTITNHPIKDVSMKILRISTKFILVSHGNRIKHFNHNRQLIACSILKIIFSRSVVCTLDSKIAEDEQKPLNRIMINVYSFKLNKLMSRFIKGLNIIIWYTKHIPFITLECPQKEIFYKI